jgi:hypothetical protein
MSIPAVRSTQPPIQWVLGFFPGEKWLGNKVDHAPPSSVKVKIEYNYIIGPLYAFRAWTGKNVPTILAGYECSLS